MFLTFLCLAENQNNFDGNTSRDSSKIRKSKFLNTSSYIEKQRYGGVGPDQSDSDDEAERKTAAQVNPDMTPISRRAKITDEKASKVKKLGTFGTFMSLLKGFVCTAILYLPDSFRSAGWAFQIVTLTFSACLTTFCALLLIKVRQKINLPSYTDLGEKLYGQKGKIAVNVALFMSQTGFCCAYIYFIVSNFHVILQQSFGFSHDQWVTAAICFVVFTLLCWVRKIEIFAQTHIFADVMILITLLYVVVMGIFYMRD